MPTVHRSTLRHLATVLLVAVGVTLGLATTTGADSHPADVTAATFQPAAADRAALTAAVA